MLHLERPSSVGLSTSMPLSTRVMLPVVSALEQISLQQQQQQHSNRLSPHLSPPAQGEDMVTDKDQAASQVSQWPALACVCLCVFV